MFIHGLGGSSDWWRRNVEAVAREHTVVAVDLVGFGRSRFFARRSALPLRFADTAALLARWIESSFDEPVHVVGNSMGGQTAIHLAARRPDLVRSLTLVNSTGIPFELTAGPHIENLLIPRGALSFTTILARDAFRSGPTSIALAFARLLLDDARPLLKSVRVPTLLLWGEHDPLVPLTYARQMAEIIPTARLVIVPRSGHIPFWENAEFFNQALLDFLSEVDRSPVIAYPPPETFDWPLAGVIDHIAYRRSGPRSDAVLIHGLGMSSSYLVHLARALFDRGLHAVAPDLRGFGRSADAPSMGSSEHAALLVEWALKLGIRDAIWIGHSHGCNVAEQVKRLRPELVREVVHVGPLWTLTRHPVLRQGGCLFLDTLREPFSLYGYVLPAYWRAGLGRWWGTFRRSLHDITTAAPPGLMIAGERDPIPDRNTVHDIVSVAGAHACLFSDPAEVAEAITQRSFVATSGTVSTIDS